jgi:hypothetical protein
MKTVIVALLAVAALLLVAPAAADAPAPQKWSITFEDVNPCAGGTHTVTIAGAVSFDHDHDGRVVARSQRTITTSPTGLVGRGTDTYVPNDHVEMFRLADILTYAAGDRIGAPFLLVTDVATGYVKAVAGARSKQWAWDDNEVSVT